MVPKKISEFKKSGMVPFSLRHGYKNKRYNIRHPKLKALTASKEHPLYDDQIDFQVYRRISEAKPDIVRFSVEAYNEKAWMSRYKYRYDGYHCNKFSNIAN